MLNAFLAALFDEATKEALIKWRLDVTKREVERTTEPQNLHLTIGYIRNIQEEDLSVVQNSLQPLKEKPAFEATLSALGLVGQGVHLKSYLCAMVTEEETSYLKQVREEGDRLLKQHTSYTFLERREFVPHITLQRLNRDLNSKEKRELRERFLKQPFKLFAFSIETLALMRRGPLSRDYRVLERYPLKK